MSINFKNMQLIIDYQEPTETHLKSINNSKSKRMKLDNISYMFHTEYDDTEKSLWIYAEYENSKIRNKKVYNEEKEQDEPNPRKNNQIEYKHQFFGIYFITTKVLYLSNLQKKMHLSKYLSEILQKDVEIKNYYTNLETFSKGISTLKNISFVTKDTLFRKKNGIFDAVDNIFGLDYAKQLHISIDYGRLSLVEKTKHFIDKINTQSKDSQIEEMVICGYDDNDVEKTLDVNNYIESVSINIDADEDTGLYEENEVKTRIIKELKDNKYV